MDVLTAPGRPRRIQRRRTRDWRMPEGAVYVGRPGPWGNPYQVGGPHPSQDRTIRDAAEAVALYREAIPRLGLGVKARRELAGRTLACWCPLTDADGAPVPCHADVLLELANGGAR